MAQRYWLMKSEPYVYSFEDLQRDGKTHWDGVRNYRARNFLRDEIKVGDRVLYYHSNAKPSCIVGLATVVRDGYPDFTAWDPESDHPDPRSPEDNPRWFMVDIRADEPLPNPVSLQDAKANPKLKEMVLVRNPRLSVQPVKKEEWDEVLRMAGMAK
ncbi:MAG: EVE domain-containing protein [Rhodothermales bacterium]|nr:EVE domain-containing protein [Rhodothermales bacterium]